MTTTPVAMVPIMVVLIVLVGTLLVVVLRQALTATRLNHRYAVVLADLAQWQEATHAWHAAYWRLIATATCPLCGCHLEPEPSTPIAEPNLRRDR